MFKEMFEFLSAPVFIAAFAFMFIVGALILSVAGSEESSSQTPAPQKRDDE